MSKVNVTDRRRDDITIAVEAHLKEGGATNICFLVAEYKDLFHTVTVAREPMHEGRSIPDFRWHLSIAAPHGVPTWDAMAAIAHEVRPGIAMCIPMPPRSQWMNYNARVLHLYEIKDYNLTQQWVAEGQGHTPS